MARASSCFALAAFYAAAGAELAVFSGWIPAGALIVLLPAAAVVLGVSLFPPAARTRRAVRLTVATSGGPWAVATRAR